MRKHFLIMVYLTTVISLAPVCVIASEQWWAGAPRVIRSAGDFVATGIDFYQISETEAAVFIVGVIDHHASEKVLRAVSNANQIGLVVTTAYLFSSGGDLSQALAIGRFFRDKRISTVAPAHLSSKDTVSPLFLCHAKVTYNYFDQFDNKTGIVAFNSEQNDECICASACAFIWFGGLSRSGSVSVHRPYFTEKVENFAAFQNSLAGAYSELQRFLAEMQIPSWVSDEVFSTASERLIILNETGSERKINDDPVFSEYIIAQCPASLSDRETAMLLELASLDQERSLSDIERVAYQNLAERFKAHADCKSQVVFREAKRAQGL